MATYEETLRAIAESDPRVVVMTAENRAPIRGLPAVLGDRFIDVGICEQTMIGAAAGLALAGRIPVCHALATFLVMRAFEFVRTDVGLAKLPVKLVGGVPGFLSEANGPTHQAIEDVALMRLVNGMQIVCPADEQELVAALPHVIASDAPCYVRYCASPAAVEHRAPFAFGRAEVLSDGADVTLLTYGFMLREAEIARATLAAAGVGVRLVNMRTLAPVDERAILGAARETRLLVTLEDHLARGGLRSIVAELLTEHRVRCRTLALAIGDSGFRPGRLAESIAYERLDGTSVAARVMAALSRNADEER